MAEAVTTSTTEVKPDAATVLFSTPVVTPAVIPEVKPPEAAVVPPVVEAAKPTDPVKDESKPVETPKEVEYKDFTLPENVIVDAEVNTEFKTIAKEMKLTQEQAQKLVDLQTKMVVKQAKESHDGWVMLQNDWKTKSESDKEFGGKDFKANIGIAKTALDKFGTKEFKEAIESTGMGNHPELIRFLYKVGKTMGEDKLNNGNVATGEGKTLAQILYPNMK